MTELECYPSEYASKNILQKLMGRGQKYWGMRRKSFVSYSGLDWHSDQHYVSYSHCVRTINLLNQADELPIYD